MNIRQRFCRHRYNDAFLECKRDGDNYEVNILPYLRGVGGNVRLDFEED